MLNVILLILAAVVLAVFIGILVTLLRTKHSERVKDTNRRVIFQGGKKVNPDAAAYGDGIIGENMDRDRTIVKKNRRAGSVETLCLTEIQSGTVYRGVFRDRRIRIGRAVNGKRKSDEGELGVDNSKVSQVHCCVRRTDCGYIVEDCHSTNHTWVNGIQVTGSVDLRSGDLLKLADKVYQVQFILEHI